MPHFEAVYEYQKRRWMRKSVPQKSRVIINAPDLAEAMRIARSEARAQQPRCRIWVAPLSNTHEVKPCGN